MCSPRYEITSGFRVLSLNVLFRHGYLHVSNTNSLQGDAYWRFYPESFQLQFISTSATKFLTPTVRCNVQHHHTRGTHQIVLS